MNDDADVVALGHPQHGPGPHPVVAERLDGRVDRVDLPLDLVHGELEHLRPVGVDPHRVERLVALGDHRELGVVGVGAEDVVEERGHPQRTGEVAHEPAHLDLAVEVVLGPAGRQVRDRRGRGARLDGPGRRGRGRRRGRRRRRAGRRAEAPARGGGRLAGGEGRRHARDADNTGRAQESAAAQGGIVGLGGGSVADVVTGLSTGVMAPVGRAVDPDSVRAGAGACEVTDGPISGRQVACGEWRLLLLGCHRWPGRPSASPAGMRTDGSAWRTTSSPGAARSGWRPAAGSPGGRRRRSSGSWSGRTGRWSSRPARPTPAGRSTSSGIRPAG